MARSNAKPIFPMVISLVLFILSLFIVQTYKQTLLPYETELTLPRNQPLYLSEKYVKGNISIQHITNDVTVYYAALPEPQELELTHQTFTTSFNFDANKAFVKSCGVAQGAMRLAFEELRCSCTYGICPEIQNLHLTLHTMTEKFDQPYIETRQEISFQVSKHQLIGQTHFETSTVFDTFQDVVLEIKPQINTTDHLQHCSLVVNYTIVFREYRNVTEKHILRPNLTEANPMMFDAKNLVLQAAPSQDFTLIQIKTTRPQQGKLTGVQQITSFVITAFVYFIYTVLQYLFCSSHEHMNTGTGTAASPSPDVPSRV